MLYTVSLILENEIKRVERSLEQNYRDELFAEESLASLKETIQMNEEQKTYLVTRLLQETGSGIDLGKVLT